MGQRNMKEAEFIKRFAVMNNAYSHFTIRYALDSLRRLGIRKIDLWAGTPHLDAAEAHYGEVRNLGRMLKARDMVPVCMTPEVLGYPYNIAASDPDVRERTLRYGIRCLAAAQELEIPLVLFGPGWRYWTQQEDEAKKTAAETLLRLAEDAKGRGIRVGVQHLTSASSNLVNSASDIAEVADLAGGRIFSAIDIGILSGRGESVSDYMKILKDTLAHVHFMDGRFGIPGPHLAAGDGDLPLRDIYNRMLTEGYRGCFTLEINAPQYLRDPESAIRQTVNHILSWQ